MPTKENGPVAVSTPEACPDHNPGYQAVFICPDLILGWSAGPVAEPATATRDSVPQPPPLPRPDVDNIAKSVLDGLQDVVGDDTRVARLAIQKAWGSEGSRTVTIATGFDGEGATS